MIMKTILVKIGRSTPEIHCAQSHDYKTKKWDLKEKESKRDTLLK